ncbi:MAG TPA: hypothetical protein VGC76_15325 [Pyrinomonadaceae bacterium]|jgi:hypothetical protein
MTLQKKILTAAAFLFLVFVSVAPRADAKPGEYKAIVNHLQMKYKAKKVKIPLLWLARFAVSVVRPAGVKSFSVTMFEGLQFSRETLDKEMQSAMRNSFGGDWSPIFHVRSREGQQAYMYMREEKNVVKITLVTIDKEQAAVIRATFSPDKLAEFMNDPKIFGISLSDTDGQNSPKKVTIIEDKEDKDADKDKTKSP